VTTRRRAARPRPRTTRAVKAVDRSAAAPADPSIVDVAWGSIGARYLAAHCDVLVIVDVLSFSTSLSIAVDRSAQVWPFDTDADGAERFAREVGAVLARGRSAKGGPTLSPASLLDLEPGSRLVLPSPNGSAIARAAAGAGLLVAGACLRNAAATVGLLAGFDRVGVVACGERWSDGSLRPAYEDWLGAGVVCAGLVAAGAEPTPDAAAAAAAASAPRPLADCLSGAELYGRGFGDDVILAEQRDVSTAVPVLQAGRFSAARPGATDAGRIAPAPGR
jgi:2-phosphosulfolactate phosphatase